MEKNLPIMDLAIMIIGNHTILHSPVTVRERNSSLSALLPVTLMKMNVSYNALNRLLNLKDLALLLVIVPNNTDLFVGLMDRLTITNALWIVLVFLGQLMENVHLSWILVSIVLMCLCQFVDQTVSLTEISAL